MDDKELILENTPLENLRNILSEADATAQVKPEESLNRSCGGVNKEEIRKIIDRLSAEPQQLLSPEALQMILNNSIFRQNEQHDVRTSIFQNTHVIELNKLINSKT